MAALAQAGEKNLFGYLMREFEALSERSLGDVDSLVLSCLSYYRLPAEAAAARTHEGMRLIELFRADWVDAMTQGLWDPDGLARLLSCVAASPRLRDVRLSDYVDDFDEAAEKQFSACTLRLPGGDAYVSFRGTDNTLVGWKEDFNMAFETGVPSQLAALAYLERVAPTIEGRIFAGGHSKGGNLAVYAAARCSEDVAAHIERVFSHDGPGFTEETLSSAEWAARATRVSKTVPRSSLIGMLFERQEDFAVVESSTFGFMQHDPFSWVVEGTDLVRVEGLDRGASYLDRSLNEWIASMTHAEREGFVDTLFSVFGASGERTFSEIKESLVTSVPAMLRELGGLGPDERSHLMRALELLVQAFMPEFSLPQLPALETPLQHQLYPR